MQQFYRFWLFLIFGVSGLSLNLQAQQTDTLKKYEDAPHAIKQKPPFYKSKVFKASIVPAILIGYGVSTIRDNGFYSSYDAREDILRKYPNFDTWLDNPLLVMPYVELILANLLNQKSNHDFINTSLLILKAEGFYFLTVFPLKELTNMERPNGEDNKSM